MASPDDLIRSFGMSGFIVSDDLRSIEREFNVELGHSVTISESRSDDFYSQFEQAVKAEAAEMSRHYEMFYCLEKSIRSLITETLYEVDGEAWWNAGKIPSNVVNEVRDRMQREVDSGFTKRSESQIDYTTFGELSVIITSNWMLFSTIFSSRRAVERVMSNLNMLRGPIAHCSPMSEDEVLRLKLTVKDWFRMIG